MKDVFVSVPRAPESSAGALSSLSRAANRARGSSACWERGTGGPTRRLVRFRFPQRPAPSWDFRLPDANAFNRRFSLKRGAPFEVLLPACGLQRGPMDFWENSGRMTGHIESVLICIPFNCSYIVGPLRTRHRAHISFCPHVKHPGG